ncbi:MAG: hypothetical protein ACO25G_02720 [Holophagaceae bacterium]|jgi:hypothetical protein
MTDTQPKKPNPSSDTVRIMDILKENKILTQSLVFFILMLFIPVLLAWKFDWFLIAN